MGILIVSVNEVQLRSKKLLPFTNFCLPFSNSIKLTLVLFAGFEDRKKTRTRRQGLVPLWVENGTNQKEKI